MEPENPFALLVTWTCYGTWLPGDERGYVSNTLRAGHGYRPKQNTPGTEFTADDVTTRERARRLQRGETVYLTVEQAVNVAQCLVKVAAREGWTIPRAAVMANHVHVVVQQCPRDGPSVRRLLKGNTQAALSELLGHSQRWWTAGGSDRYKKDLTAIEAAIQYVAKQEHKLAEIIDMVATAWVPPG